MKLLNPGPVTLTSRVRNTLLGPDLCHREPEFGVLETEIRTLLTQVYNAPGYTAVLITGSGTAAVEAMVGSLVPSYGHALVVANGAYGQRIADMLRAQQKTSHLAESSWVDSINLMKVEELLKTHPEISHVIAVHHETTTGRLNDIAPLGELCKMYDKKLLLDTVSSFGGEAIDFMHWNLEAVAATANKCLHGVPGVSFVLVRKETLEKGTSGAASIYLDLFRHYPEQERGSTAFTQSAQICYALKEALLELKDAGGWQARNRHYRELSGQVFRGLTLLGIQPLLSIDLPSSSILTSYRLPAGSTYPELHDHLKSQGFVIYAGHGQFSQDIFRIAVMGDVTSSDIERLLQAFKNFLND
ncbi:MAG TPA: 2-aminoethylphosphonate aminotransferase [Patescibacteria group bacterium]|nr:2-aminoethylphosphonate aminotransferase [Patescibacteria group bacterium]